MILITGGAGFIGSNIAHVLCGAGKTVAIADRLGHDDKWRNIAKLDLLDIVAPGTILDWLKANEARVEAVVHMGAISSTTERDADLIVDVNFRLSRDLWNWCAQSQRPFVYASSAATYGDGRAGFDDDGSIEHLQTLRPMNAYGWSKHLFDRWCARRVASGDRAPPYWAGLKFFNVYGPNEDHKGPMKSVAAQIYPRVAEGDAVQLFRSHRLDYADGKQLRDFVYVKDCAAIVAWMIDRQPPCGLYNLGTGAARSFLDLATCVFRALNKDPNIEYIEIPDVIRLRYQYFTQANMTRLRSAGYQGAFATLEDGVEDYVRNYLAAPDPYL